VWRETDEGLKLASQKQGAAVYKPPLLEPGILGRHRGHPSMWWRDGLCPVPLFRKRSGDVAEDDRVVVLTGLVGKNLHIAAARRSEFVLADIGDRVGQAVKESLHGNDILGIDNGVVIHISRRQLASRQERSGQELLLHADHIDGIDVAGAWRPSGLARRYGIGRARQHLKRIVTGRVGQG
jgi:hypothetical protein